MKCIILAGGRGERLWPLSRKNYPKQFIEIQKNHSVFQETVARNIPYCDEFIIVTNYEYRFIISNQMKAFQGITYRCIYEEQPHKTTAAIMLACLSLQPSEYIFVVAADHLIDTASDCNQTGCSYKEAILKAKESAFGGSIVLFGAVDQEPDSKFGYIRTVGDNCTVTGFIEKPVKKEILDLKKTDSVYRNLGMLLFQNGSFQNEVKKLQPEIFVQCRTAFDSQQKAGKDTFYPFEVQRIIEPVSIEKSILERSGALQLVKAGYKWQDIGSLEDLTKTEFESYGLSIENDCANSIIINQSAKKAVVINELDNVLVVNTDDAVYVGRYGKSADLKYILHDNPELDYFSEKGTHFYRSWGYYEQLIEEKNYRIRRVYLFPGKTIYEHKHGHRSENWTVVNGTAQITLDGVTRTYHIKDNIDIPIGVNHQISNIGDDVVVFVETAVGEILHGDDTISASVSDINETQLGYKQEPMIKLSPAFKDYLWGGTKLRDIYHKPCDYDIIAESWELSAHEAGQSIVATGKHKGEKFGDYLEAVGKDDLGWKCSPLQAFPLLIKFIDAKGNLSVQVHPDDDYALEKENQYGKNEMWYVIDSEPGSGLYVGFNRDVSREEVEERVKNNTIMDVLNFYPTKPGDVFFIPAGTVHAIGAGNLICEIQQSSNCTYRLYDYDRRDKFGNPRELHIPKALDVLNFNKYIVTEPEKETSSDGSVLVRCKYFESTLYEVDDKIKISLENDRFYSIVCIKGEGCMQIADMSMDVKAGESVFVPAQNGILIVSGKISVVINHI